MKNFPTMGPIIIGSKDAKIAKEFYIKVFGITIQVEKPNYISARLSDGTHIEIEEDSANRFPNWEKNNVGTYKNSQFMVPNIEKFLKTVVENNGSVVSPIKSKPWGSTAEIADPEGNIFLIGETKNI